MFQEGQQFGSYTLIRKLGRGGFGEVWLAEKRAKFVTTKVAVKLPLDNQVDHEAIKQEATLWERASGHANVLPIIEADEYEGQVVIVSEYAPDGSLEEWLKTNGKMSVGKAVEMTIKILEGLEFLHSRNIIHRDLKPANILLQGETPLLGDFGISRALRTTVSSQSNNISGTFAYMPPEAFDGKRSIQTDIWSIGVNLYQFLTGNLPYPQKEPSALIAAIMMREFEPIPSYVPIPIKKVIKKALAKHPENRYKTAKEMREDLLKASLKEPSFNQGIFSKENDIPPLKGKLPEISKNVVTSHNSYKEVETITRPKSLTPVQQNNKKTQKTNLNLYVSALLFFLVISILGWFFYKTSPENKPLINSTEPLKTPENQVRQSAAELINSAQNHFDNKRYFDAKNDYTKAIELDPQNAEAYNSRGNVYAKQGLNKIAIADYTSAIQINPKEAKYFYNRALSYEAQNQLSLASDDYGEAIRLNPKDAENYLNRGVVFDRRGRHDLAIEDFQKAISLEANNSDAYNNLGIVYGNQGDFIKGFENFNKALQLNPKNDKAYINRARLYGKQEKYNLAIADLNSAIRLNPKDSEAYSLRAWTNCTLGKKQLALMDERKTREFGGFIPEPCQ